MQQILVTLLIMFYQFMMKLVVKLWIVFGSSIQVIGAVREFLGMTVFILIKLNGLPSRTVWLLIQIPAKVTVSFSCTFLWLSMSIFITIIITLELEMKQSVAGAWTQDYLTPWSSKKLLSGFLVDMIMITITMVSMKG